ncbi:hypothetical protein BDP81DRAFT_414447 [Colletotrichum phormii]|uniref:Uncharacterized protein n=1 Tax=Colletotrichum phormii TaxID=359342 RepID=A0AAJ0EP45_9PEZI|nr:uncharacterized protein BDP81DRAFT_414447 [Colletotrichum phormii]KAK1656239.1 hypothetical protein BDP81DRAFT_414447 [Colletotrichum phormii]
MGPTEPELDMPSRFRTWHEAARLFDLHRSDRTRRVSRVSSWPLIHCPTVNKALLSLLCPAAKEHVEMNQKKFQPLAGPPTFQSKRPRGALRGLAFVTPWADRWNRLVQPADVSRAREPNPETSLIVSAIPHPFGFPLVPIGHPHLRALFGARLDLIH